MESTIARFEDAWQAGDPPLLDEYLVDAGSNRLELLRELVAIDLEYRLRFREQIRVEDYFQFVVPRPAWNFPRSHLHTTLHEWQASYECRVEFACD